MLRPRLLLPCLLLLAPAAQAESEYRTGNASPIVADARLDFEIVVPKILYLRVGTGSNFASNAAIDLIAFNVPAAQVGSGAPVAATAGSGDLGNGAVTARVLGNNGAITLSATTPGALNNGLGDTISYSQLSTSASSLSTPSPLPAVPLADGATTSTTLPAVAGVVNRDARWTYAYQNAALVAPGTYGGVNVRNGRITYTVSMP